MPHPKNARSKAEGYLVAAPRRRPAGNRKAARIVVATVVAVAVIAGTTAAVGLLGQAPSEAQITAPSPRAGESTPTPTPTPTIQTSLSTTALGQTMLLELPAGGEATGLALYFPDRTADAATALASPSAVALKEAGWALAAVEGSGAQWGSPDSSAATRALLEWAATLAPTSPTIVVAEGTGAATSIAAIARSEGTVPACWLGLSPQSDLMAHGQADPAIESEILRAWGAVPDSDQLPLALVEALPTATSYRVVSPDSGAPVLVQADAATLVASLESSGHEVTVIQPDENPTDLVGLAEGCTA
ncbi:hypothetical protein ABZ477_08755 [Microbacterium sp. NPDC019599]|uniref:hypothetical protein n=1 Tax=Microbacterium sp. NPDC019599 TaxID=3154690 RepID=UPI0033E4B106